MANGKCENLDRHTDRQSNIELLRIVVMAMIVCCHFATHGGFCFDSHSITIPRLWWNAIEMGGNFGVDVFIIISGYFLIDNKNLSISLKKTVRVWGQIFFYSILLFFVAFIIGRGDASPKNIIKTLLPITFGKWWFASTYFVMYLIHPYINRLLYSFTKEAYQKFILFALFIWCIIPTFTTSSFQSNALIEFVLLYSIAGYIKLHGFHRTIASKTWFGIWLFCSVLTYLSCVLFMLLGTKIEFFSAHSIYFYSRNSILTICRAVSFFMAFLTMDIGINRLINKVSSATFGVYLLHDSNLLKSLLWNDVFHNSSFQNTVLIIPYSIIVVLAVYIVCTLVDLIRIKCIEKPIMKVVYKCSKVYEIRFNKFISSIKTVVFGKKQ